MLKEEFKELSGLDLTDREFDMVNAIYMLSETESKDEFALRFAKFNKYELLSACAQVLEKSYEKNNNQWHEIKAKENVLLEVAELIRKGHYEDAVIKIKNCLGNYIVIRHLWERAIPLIDEDIRTLIYKCATSNFD